VIIAIAFVWPAFLLGVFIVGLGFGAFVLGLNQFVAYSESRRRTALLNALNGAYSAGAVGGPILVATFAGEHFSPLYLVFAAVWLALIPAAIGITGRLPVSAGSRVRPGSLVWIFILAFVLYGAIGIVIAQAGVSWAPAVLAVVAIGMSITFFVAARRTAAQ